MMRDIFHTVNGLRLHSLDWETEGKPPVMLLHGLAVFAHAWDHNSAALQNDFHIVALDQRGHGDSDRGTCSDYRTEVYASDILGVADALGWRRFSLVGQSMGGHNAMYVAAMHPDRVERLVISDMEPVMRVDLIAYMREAERLPEYDTLEDVIAEAAARNPRRWADDFGEIWPQVPRRAHRQAATQRQTDTKVRLQCAEMLGGAGLVARSRQNRLPNAAGARGGEPGLTHRDRRADGRRYPGLSVCGDRRRGSFDRPGQSSRF